MDAFLVECFQLTQDLPEPLRVVEQEPVDAVAHEFRVCAVFVQKHRQPGRHRLERRRLDGARLARADERAAAAVKVRQLLLGKLPDKRHLLRKLQRLCVLRIQRGVRPRTRNNQMQRVCRRHRGVPVFQKCRYAAVVQKPPRKDVIRRRFRDFPFVQKLRVRRVRRHKRVQIDAERRALQFAADVDRFQFIGRFAAGRQNGVALRQDLAHRRAHLHLRQTVIRLV